MGRVIESVETDAEAARSSVAASWTRSYRLHGLSPDDERAERRCDAGELAARRDRAGRLLRISAPTIDRLFLTLRLAGCSLVLCDADGVILEHRRLDGDSADFEKAGLNAGADWSENAQGTNGIGTCIAEQRSTSILKDQHFHASNIGMSCFGAPVFDSRGGIQAVLDVSTCRESLDPALSLLIEQAVLDAAVQIEADHFRDEYSDMRIIQTASGNHRLPALLAVDRYDLVVGATRSARRQYGLPLNRDFSPSPAADLLGDAVDRGTGFESAERRELRRALARANGNMSAAARALGVSRATLYRRAAKLGLTPEQDDSAS
ncbi:MAG: helix-turn-helix domain-containing protein [Hyphomonas sp.]